VIRCHSARADSMAGIERSESATIGEREAHARTPVRHFPLRAGVNGPAFPQVARILGREKVKISLSQGPHRTGSPFLTIYSPSPSGRGRGEGQLELVRAVTRDRLPYADLKAAIVLDLATTDARPDGLP
jgi:hypothetical protein